tara:strand:+ start:302 stop:442 length:141 start_codon:yes stop_codon:yes gene_type:complete
LPVVLVAVEEMEAEVAEALALVVTENPFLTLQQEAHLSLLKLIQLL